MTEYIKNIIVECNRTRSKVNVNGIPENQDEFKNRWTNNVSTTGISVDIGDTIQLEAGCINSKGANQDVIEFIGENENNILDNKAELELGFYVNHCGRNTAVLPLQNQLCFPKDRSGSTYTTFNNVLQRDIGGFPRGISNPETSSDYSKMSPFVDIITMYNLTSEGNYYEAGKYYLAKGNGDISPPANTPFSTGENIIIQVISTKSASGGDIGIIDQYKYINEGVNIGSYENTGAEVNKFTDVPATFEFSIECDRAGNVLHDPRLTPGSGGSAPVVAQAELTIKGSITPDFYMKTFKPPDNSRYYFLDPDYTGVDYVNWSDTDDHKQIDEVVKLRSNKVILEVPIGYNTPDNVSKVLTDILHEPTQVEKTTPLPFSSFETYKSTAHDYNNYGGVTKNLPSIVSTPTYQPTPANGNPNANKQNQNPATSYETYRPDPNIVPTPSPDPPADLQECMTRRSYYSCIAYKDPERFEGLQFFRNFTYRTDNNDPDNDINTGINPIQVVTPFGNQTVGQLGNRVCCLNNLPTSGGQTGNIYCKFPRGTLILTNMYYTQENITDIANGFRKNEKYLNGFNKQESFGSKDYEQYSGCFLDFGMYDDQTSYEGENFFFGSRADYDQNGGNWHIGTQTFSPAIESASPDIKYPCFDIQRDGSRNTGKQLGGLWVQSYWRDDFLTQNINGVTKPTDGIEYQEFLNSLTIGQNYDGNFDLPDENNANSGFSMLKNNSGENTYEEMIAWAQEYNVACIPVYNTRPGNTFNNGKPYIAFVSAVNTDSPQEVFGNDYDYNLGVPQDAIWDFYKTIDEQTWFLSKFNIQYGFPIGFDNSFTRNDAVLFTNLQETRELDPGVALNYAQCGMIGAVNPGFKYDPIAGRFEISGLNSGMTIGNGNLQQPPEELEASDDPEQLCYNVGSIGNIQPYFNPAKYTDSSQNNLFPYAKDGYFPALDMRQKSSSIIQSQSGVSILNITLFFSFDPNSADDGIPLNFPSLAQEYYTDCLFDKMGFTVTQLLPNIGSSQSFFTNNLEFRGTSGNYASAYQNSKPMTTGQYISSAEIQASTVNSIDMPNYDLGINFFRSARPDVDPASITAFSIPKQLSYPYLCIYSDIATAGADTTYYGGVDSHSKIPCMAFMTRNYNNKNFFYALESTFNYTVTRPFVITDITTDIRLPDGKRPRLDSQSAVIYKIQKSGVLPGVSQTQIKSKLNINERRKDIERRREVIRKTSGEN